MACDLCLDPLISYLDSALGIAQTLDIVAENPDKFRVVALAAGSNVTLLADQVTSEYITCYRSCNDLLFSITTRLKSKMTKSDLYRLICLLT